MRRFVFFIVVMFAAVPAIGASALGRNAPTWSSGPSTAAAALPQSTATIVVLKFDELPFQPVNGIHYKGVKFGFTVAGKPSTDAHYHASGPGKGKYVQDPSLEGNASGTLTLTFDKATPLLKFGVACLTGTKLSAGSVVKAYDVAGHLISTYKVPVKVYPGNPFSQGLFTYPGHTAVKKAVITFASQSFPAFAFDNLTYKT